MYCQIFRRFFFVSGAFFCWRRDFSREGVLSGVLVVGFAQAGVVAALFVVRPVVAVCEAIPVFLFQVFYEVCLDAEPGEQFELLRFRRTHPAHEFVKRPAATVPPVEPANLKHAPEGRFVGDFPVDGPRRFDRAHWAFP